MAIKVRKTLSDLSLFTWPEARLQSPRTYFQHHRFIALVRKADEYFQILLTLPG